MPPIFDVESLLLLVDEGDLDGVSALVAAKGEGVVQSKDEWGLTSLHLASATGNEVRRKERRFSTVFARGYLASVHGHLRMMACLARARRMSVRCTPLQRVDLLERMM